MPLHIGIKNFLVVSLDDNLHNQLQSRGVASYRVHNDARVGPGANDSMVNNSTAYNSTAKIILRQK